MKSRKDAKIFATRTGRRWVDSSQVDYCAECDRKFTITRRKHHCRQCGEVICSRCSPNRVVIGLSNKSDSLTSEATPSRICNSCFVEHQKFTSISPSSSYDKEGNIVPEVNREVDNGRYEKINRTYTSKKYFYGPSPSQYFVLHVPREVLSASAALQHAKAGNKSQVKSTYLPNSVPIVVLIHGGFWKYKYNIENSSIESLVPFFLSKGMAVCQIEYRRIGSTINVQKITSQEKRQFQYMNSPYQHSMSPLLSPNGAPPSHLMYMHLSSQFLPPEGNWEVNRGGEENASQHVYSFDDKPRCNDEGGFPETNDDVLKALRLLHHKCEQINSSTPYANSFTHHYIAANGSRCVSQLSKLDTSRTVLFGHSAGGYLSLWTCCRFHERKLPFKPLLCVSVAPVCNLLLAHQNSVGGSSVTEFLTSSPQTCSNYSYSSDLDGSDCGNKSPVTDKNIDSRFLDIAQSACPSALLPVEIPLLLVSGTRDSDIPTSMVEDFYWKARESSFQFLPPVPNDEQTIDRSTVPIKTVSSEDETKNESTACKSGNLEEDVSVCYVRESVSLPIKLIKIPDADHYTPVAAHEMAFLELYDELFVIAPNLADVPELDILMYRPEEIRMAMDYNANSNNSSDALQGSANMKKSFSSNNLKVAANDKTHDINDDNTHSYLSTKKSLKQRRSQSHDTNDTLAVDKRTAECLDLVDTVELNVEKLVSYSSSDDEGSDDGYYTSTSILVDKSQEDQLANTPNSRDSDDHLADSMKKQTQVAEIKPCDGGAASDDMKGKDVLGVAENSDKPLQDSENFDFFSFPTPVNKSRRTFHLPKFV